MDPKITCYCKKELQLGEDEIYAKNPTFTGYKVQCGNCLRIISVQINENRPFILVDAEKGNEG